MVFVPAVGTLLFQELTVMPPAPPVSDRDTSKVMTSAALAARPGGPVAVSTAASPTFTVVLPLANVTAPERQPIFEEPVVSMVCEPPSLVTMRPMKMLASLAASTTTDDAAGCACTVLPSPINAFGSPKKVCSA